MNLSDIKHLLTERATTFLGRGTHDLFINGQWVAPQSGRRIATLNPATEATISEVASAGPADVDQAVLAAHSALREGPWGRMRPVERERLMLRLADLMEANAQALAEVESIDNGKSAAMARAVDMALAVDFVRYMAGWATKIEGSTHEHSVPFALQAQMVAYTRREPVGVVAAVVPWNFPLLVAIWKLGPALAAGCTVVLKPAEQTPLTALMLAELTQEAGFPPGVFNVVTGDGPGTGAPLVSHPLVNKVSFTGSTEVGKLIGHACVDHMTRFTLELGGKSPVIVLDDCDPATAAAGAANAIFFNHGQVCCAGSRLYVQKKMFDRVVADVADHARQLTLGHGLDPAAQMGPLVSQEQMDRVCGYIDIGRSQGAEVLAGGGRAGERGYFVQPTVLASVRPEHRVVREEIFGPVLVAMPYDDLDEVAAWANDSPFGLGASIWSNNLSQVHRLIPKLQAGSVWVNCHSMLDPGMPFGGYKQSGIGRDMGRAALDAYLETKSVFINV
ncbi:MAG: aldehyde dehydrogenase [Acidovorax sp. 17-64-282]|jgi:phenylacetaldehyde dehydrogenase|uniref:aldehyde dehydrogenase family protein n=3 Tax=unclassified Acidovorax TaxID=2684926 RepID=UPI000BC9597D|nr:aldehyde dehydrogenase family protein [Acidovorax sp.]OZA57883.1 MAG: aldehyde dehydrogenase [Acidovorax sp. 17-64-282]HQQ68872.1 aldehyde dehydrogenase family protein [Alicycliphilus sp.]HQT19426.1 aldehyde dehydrogenase family protein [Acidovorax defluvii]HQT51559.1 aldehyde dehydrogenase family protein [Acidovorax defluvii]